MNISTIAFENGIKIFIAICGNENPFLKTFVSTFMLKGVFICSDEKKTLRSSQDSNLGPLNSSQMLSPTELLEL